MKNKSPTISGLVGGFLSIAAVNMVLSETIKGLKSSQSIYDETFEVKSIEEQIKEKGLGQVFAEQLGGARI